MINLRLRPEEEAALNLRGLYESYGYTFYRMSRFEEYDFYADKKDFLTSKSILTFTDINGKLMALRPDVTLSIVKHIKDFGSVQKFYYDEKVYRVPRNANSFREISQAGIECVGGLHDDDLREVLELAILSLHTVAGSRRCVLDVADAGMIAELLPDTSSRAGILKCIAEKNIHGLEALNAPEKVIRLVKLNGEISSALPELDGSTRKVLASLTEYHDELRVDFSAVNNLNYYNGIVFRGFIEGMPEAILSGGQYDNLMRLMKHDNARAVGFAVYLDMIERSIESE